MSDEEKAIDKEKKARKERRSKLTFKEVREKTKELKPIDYKFLLAYIDNGGDAMRAAAEVRGYDLTDPKERNAAAKWGCVRLKKLKPTVKEEMEAQGLTDKELIAVLREGLEAIKVVRSQIGTQINEDPDYKTRHLYLDTAFKLKGKYPNPKIDVNLSNKTGVVVVPDVSDPELWQKMLELTRPFIEQMRGADSD